MTTSRSTRRRPAVRVSASLATLAVAALISGGPALAAGSGSPDVEVTNTETVQVYTDATGKIDTRRVYEQLSLTGKGSVDLDNPVSKAGVRNLDGFGGTGADQGIQHVETTVDGEKKLRTVSDYDGSLPLTLAVVYKLDGKVVDPSDVVGESGRLEVSYTVKNVSAVEKEVSFDDGLGGTVTKTVDVPIPMVGSLTTVAPPSFTDVSSDEANMAGDGKGGTKMSFTMTLIPPIGSDIATFGYTADIVDGVVPRAEMSALPVDPLVSPSFKNAATSYDGGAQTGVELTGGATEIDSNLLKLRDGAGDLLAGLIQLRDGADQLSDGLVDDAAPGARKLADGAGELDEGLGKLNDGSGELAAGTGKLRSGADDLDAGAAKLDDGADKLAAGADTLGNGTGDALAGSKSLTDGLGKISSGLDQLGDKSVGLPAAAAGIDQLKAGVDQLSAGLGDPSKPTTLIGGLTALTGSLGDAKTGAASVAAGLRSVRGDSSGGLVKAKGGVDSIQPGLEDASKNGGGLDQLSAGIGSLTPYCNANPQCEGTITALRSSVSLSKTNLGQAAAGLTQISTGLGTAVTGLNAQLIPGADALESGLGQAQTGAGQLTAGAQAAGAGSARVRAGLNDLATGVTKAVAGVVQLSTGANSASAGSSSLTAGLGKIDAGAGALAAGADKLDDGTGELKAGTTKLSTGAGDLDDGASRLKAGAGDAADGSDQLAAGADELADGLGDAADGSTELSDGLKKAAGGAPDLVDGAQRLSDEGTQKLVAAGESTAQDYGEMYATLVAGAERAGTDDMAVGAPKGAVGLTAYSFVIQGEDGEGGRNLTRGLAGLGLLGAGAGVIGLRRRLL